MDKKIEKFKADYAEIKSKVIDIKKKLQELRKESKPIVKAASRLYKRGDKTMYIEEKDRIITAKFNGLSTIMENLEFWMDLDSNIKFVIENTL